MKTVRFKLSLMMFLEYFIWGAWYVTMTTYLGKTLKFQGGDIGLAYSTVSIADMVSASVAGMVADRFFATEKILPSLHVRGGLRMYAASGLHTFSSLFRTVLGDVRC